MMSVYNPYLYLRLFMKNGCEIGFRGVKILLLHKLGL